MAPAKSLAAEIEAVLGRRLHVSLTPAAGGPSAKIVGIPEAASEIAALQSRAFEDGARWMRERAFDVARAWQVPAAPPTADETLIARVQARNETVAGIAAGIVALPLQPEGKWNA